MVDQARRPGARPDQAVRAQRRPGFQPWSAQPWRFTPPRSPRSPALSVSRPQPARSWNSPA